MASLFTKGSVIERRTKDRSEEHEREEEGGGSTTEGLLTHVYQSQRRSHLKTCCMDYHQAGSEQVSQRSQIDDT